MLLSYLPSVESFSKYYDFGKISLEQAAISIICKRKFPKHIGIILDGNRRFAEKKGLNASAGHYAGYERLVKSLDLFAQMGLTEFTVYAFSMENFKRSPKEVDYIMELFSMAFESIGKKDKTLSGIPIRMRLLGNLEYLPENTQEIARKTIESTKNNKGITFNICCPYTSRDEMTRSIKKNVKMIIDGQLDFNDVNQNTIKQHLFTSDSPPLDIMLRTSGETRLSDFLLLQSCHGCQIHFVDCSWPEFSVWTILPILLEYQIYDTIKPELYISKSN